jgi:hypothetical protein
MIIKFLERLISEKIPLSFILISWGLFMVYSKYQQHVDRRIYEMRQRLIHFQKRKKQARKE